MGNQVGIVEATGDTWKTIKKSASGAFSLIRLKKSISLFNDCYKVMIDYIQRQIDSGNNVIDGASLSSKISVNVLASVGLGHNINSFEDPNNEFKKKLDALFEIKRWQGVEVIPNIAKLFRIQVFNPDSVQFIETIIKRTMEQRKKRNILGKDILGSLIKINEENPSDEHFHVVLKTYIQFMTDGGFATAELLGATLYYIIAHPEVYSKILEEQDNTFGEDKGIDGKVRENEINQLTYLDMVILETCRLSSIDKTARTCTKPWKIPDSDITIPSGTEILMPISAIHRDPEFWDSPDEFIPERFSSENKVRIKGGTYLPFGTGPRQCLGNIYVKFHIKMAVTHLLRNFTLHNFENLPKVMERAYALAFLPKNGLNLKVSKREF